VLDNFEQALAAAPYISQLLHACPSIIILITSRRPLHISEEQVFPLPPLPLPNGTGTSGEGADRLQDYAAVRLYSVRSQAVDPAFHLTDETASAVAEICRRLDGLPLAIELAAARGRLLPPAALLDRLDLRLDLLTGGGPDRPGRHQTMRAAIAWSYDLLAETEQSVFRRLSIATGSLSLATAEALGQPTVDAGTEATAATTSLATLDSIAALLDASLVQRTGETNGEPRLAMLETIREFGLEMLRECGELAEMQERHAAHYLQVAEKVAAELYGREQRSSLAHLDADHDNMRTALRWSLEAPGRAEYALRLAGALHWFWYLRGHFREGRRWLEHALATSADTGRARALAGASILAYRQGDYTAGREHLLQSIELCRAEHDLTSFTHALHFLAIGQLLHADQETLRDLIPESVAHFRQDGNRWALATSLSAMGMLAMVRQRYDEAAEPFAESEAICRDLGDTWGLARVLHYSGELSRHDGAFDIARRRYEEARILYRELGHRFAAATVLHNLGYVAQHQGDLPRAMTCFAEALEQHLHHGNRTNVAHCLGGIAGIAAHLGRPRLAAKLFGAAAAMMETMGVDVWPIDRPDYERNLEAARRQLGAAAFETAWQEGQRAPFDEIVTEARHEVARVASDAEGPQHQVALTPRQREILALLSAGHSNQEIGALLQIGRRTVETHIATIYGKLGVHGRAEAAAVAVRDGLI
jgi:predicted ATPase/DNA-binding CsgD family transcriptional regulator